MVAQLSSSASLRSQQQKSVSQRSPTAKEQQEEQLYYAQLHAAQQQAMTSASSSSSASSSDAGGGGSGEATTKKISDRERKEREWSERNTNLIVNYVPQNMNQEEVRALFGSMGEVESCKLIRDKATGQSLGYAFVNYERPEDAQKALISMNGLRIQNKTLKVSMARPSKDDIKGANLYVSGLPKSLTQPELEAVFRPFGAIITSRILYDNVTGLSKGVGFVRFDRKAEAEIAIEKMSGTSPWGGEEAISVKFANSPATNTAKGSSTTTAVQQMAQSLLPLQMIQQSTAGSAIAASQHLSLPSLLPIPLSAAVAAVQPATGIVHQQPAGGGPIHGHHPQHRFRYSPLAGVPLFSASAPIFSTANAVNTSTTGSTISALSALNPSLVDSMSAIPAQSTLAAAATPSLSAVNQEYLALLQQQLLQQQLSAAAYGGIGIPNFAVNQSCLPAVAQQQYAAYASALAQLGTAAPVVPSQLDLTSIGGAPKSPIGTFTLSVCNLAPDTEESALWKLFGPFGAVLSVKVAKGTGVALVTMANYEDTVAAINGLNGSQLAGRNLQVALSSPPASGGNAGTCLPSLIR